MMAGAASIRLNMLDLIALIVCQALALEEMGLEVKKSSGRATLEHFISDVFQPVDGNSITYMDLKSRV